MNYFFCVESMMDTTVGEANGEDDTETPAKKKKKKRKMEGKDVLSETLICRLYGINFYS